MCVQAFFQGAAPQSWALCGYGLMGMLWQNAAPLQRLRERRVARYWEQEGVWAIACENACD